LQDIEILVENAILIFISRQNAFNAYAVEGNGVEILQRCFYREDYNDRPIGKNFERASSISTLNDDEQTDRH